jgi:two-component system, LytTR family, response regulator
MKLRVIIVDDETLARERLRRLLSSRPDVELLADCADGPSAVDAVRQHRPDVLILDVQMPGMDGFEVLRALGPKELPAVIFVTAFDEHAVRAFEARALDYLLKPASRARLGEALGRVRERLKTVSTLPESLIDLLAAREAAAGRVRRLVVRNGERVAFVSTEEIDWIEAAGNYVILHAGQESHILRETMNALEEQLGLDPFLRVSRSAIVNLRRVKEIRSVTAGEHVAILEGGQRIPMTRSLREVEERLRFG